ncbi:hypothetical protein H6F88_13770 [Oculatella sp. FACHB-28]|uniref:hypothetical protein n=1 Tax=Oculatella sp. FACHB-28 TaxID=2692845 RepID=UPI001683BC7C|nr:hypothetical protein [Oculatella sp. FACHB-28]MBD2057072.1 hypothetical protein [Oculatella sp. FACHB-28]
MNSFVDALDLTIIRPEESGDCAVAVKGAIAFQPKAATWNGLDTLGCRFFPSPIDRQKRLGLWWCERN